MRFVYALIFIIVPIQGICLCVSIDGAALYEAATVKSRRTFYASKYFPLLELAYKSGWFQVQDQDGEKHWIERRVVRKDWECVSVKSKRAPLRVAPAKDAKLGPVGYVDRYSAFQKLEREGAWLKVEDDFKKIYWVNETDVWEPLKVHSFEF